MKQAAVPAATLLAGAAVPTIALTVGWRWAFMAGAAVGLFAAASVPASDASRPSPRTYPDVAETPLATLALLALGIGLGASAAGTLGAFLVSAGVDTGLSEAAAGLTLTVGSIVGVTVRLWAGVRADRRVGGHLRVVARMLGLGAVAFGLFAVGVPWAHVAATPLAFGVGWAWPGLFNLAVVRANQRAPATATGVTQTGAYVGAMAGPLAFGVLAEHTSYRVAWLAAGTTAVAAAAAVVAARSRLRRHLDVAVAGPVPA